MSQTWKKNPTLLTHRVKALLLARIYPDSLRHPPPLVGTSCDAMNLLDSSLSMRLILCRTLTGSSYIMYLLSVQARNHYVHGSLLTS